VNIQLKKRRDFDPVAFLAKAGLGRKLVHLGSKERAFSQGDPADSVFYIQSGRIRLSVIAKTGKEATVALLGAGDFCGEGVRGLISAWAGGKCLRDYTMCAPQD
jgi:CRP/FNR family transcriptional regulator, cyclic AMP receptor protein